MKKLVSIALVALILSISAVSFASYCTGDKGGVFACQIDKAINCGGDRSGAPMPLLPWQTGAVSLKAADLACNLNNTFGSWYCRDDQADPKFSIGIANRLPCH